MRKLIFQKNPTWGNRGKSGIPPTTKSKNHNVQTSNTKKVVIWQEDVKGENPFQRKDRSILNQKSRLVKSSWAVNPKKKGNKTNSNEKRI